MNSNFSWDKDDEKAFNELRNILEPQLLATAHSGDEITLYLTAISIALIQDGHLVQKHVYYVSKSFYDLE